MDVLVNNKDKYCSKTSKFVAKRDVTGFKKTLMGLGLEGWGACAPLAITRVQTGLLLELLCVQPQLYFYTLGIANHPISLCFH